MTEDFLSELAASFKASFEKSFNAPARHSVRSRPSFLNPFRSWRDEEKLQLRRLYAHAEQAYETSVFAREDGLARTSAAFTKRVCEGNGLDPEDAIARAIGDTATVLFDIELFSFPFLREEDWAHLDIERANALRIVLENKLKLYEEPEKCVMRAAHVCLEISNLVVSQIAVSGRDQDSSSGMAVDATLIELMNQPAEVIQNICGMAFERELVEACVFNDVRTQIESNFCTVSGIEWRERNSSARPYVMPTEQTKQSPLDLAGLYLRNTPFERLLTATVPFVVAQETRFEHCHVIGGTGHGKTQCLQYLIHDDLLRAVVDERLSLVVMDSHGSLIRNLLSSALFDPDKEFSLASRLILIDPTDIDRPPALNLFDPGLDRLAAYAPRQRELAFNSLIDIYGRFFGALLGADLTAKQGTVFRYLAKLMLTIEGATIHTLIALMDDVRPFSEHIQRLDGTARRFFENEFSRKGFNATRQQIKDRLYAVLSIPTFERLFSASESRVNFFDELNSGKIVLIDTAKGLLKEEGTAIFGRFMLALIEHAIAERASIPDVDRTPTFFYMDEAQDYFDDTVETLLVEARKYRCGLTLAHQSLAQLSPRLRAIFMGNTTVKFAGGVTEADARALAPDMRTTPEKLLSMRKQERAGTTEFALSVRNVLPHAISAHIPLGHLETHPTLEPRQLDTLLDRNRERIGYGPVMGEPTTDASDQRSTVAREVVVGHRDLQDRIRREAQARGFAANVEKKILDGAGSVDVALERGDTRIACEVSVTTRSGHEAHNIEKCLAAGFQEVWLTSPDDSQLTKLQEKLETDLGSSEREKVRFLSPSALIEQLDSLARTAPIPRATVLGYEIEVRYRTPNAPEAEDRAARLQAVVKQALSSDSGA